MMSMPGFTAEVSLYESTEGYRLAATPVVGIDGQTITPQGWGCLLAAIAGHAACGPGCGIAAHILCEMLTEEGTAY
jgi:hypothetical protein